METFESKLYPGLVYSEADHSRIRMRTIEMLADRHGLPMPTAIMMLKNRDIEENAREGDLIYFLVA